MIWIERGAEVDGPDGDKRPNGHPNRHHGKWEYHCDQYPLICGYSRQPLLDAADSLQRTTAFQVSVSGTSMTIDQCPGERSRICPFI